MSLLSRETWGPSLWYVLHTLARKSGELLNPVLETDEAHTWVHLMKNLEFIMPCALCANHYHKWVLKKPINEIMNTRGNRRKEWLETFWWGLHENVNERNNKPTFVKDDLNKYDSADEFGHHYDLIKRMVSTAIQQSQLRLSSAKAGLKYLEVLKRMYAL